MSVWPTWLTRAYVEVVQLEAAHAFAVEGGAQVVEDRVVLELGLLHVEVQVRVVLEEVLLAARELHLVAFLRDLLVLRRSLFW